jgi:hypothetical protein
VNNCEGDLNKTLFYYWRFIYQRIKDLFSKGSTLVGDPEESRLLLTGGILLAIGILLLWQWQLGLAVMAGSLVMILVYSFQTPSGQEWWKALRQNLAETSAPLAWAVGWGGIATLGTYTVVSIWSESPHRWLVTGAILQGLATFTLLGLLLWEWIKRRQEESSHRFDRHLRDIASLNPFERLTGVRQLEELLNQSTLTPEQTRLGVDYLRLALEKESTPVVREALLEALQGRIPVREWSPFTSEYPAEFSVSIGDQE